MNRGSLSLLAACVVVAALLIPSSSTTTLVAAPNAGPAGGTAGLQGVTITPVDFDGDHKTDWAIVRNTGGGPTGQLTWFSLTQAGVVTVTPWGLAGDFVVPGDYDGDGKADLAVWRPGNPGIFYVRRSTDGSLLVQPFGHTGDDPKVIGDYDGDGRTDFAVYRPGASSGLQSTWFWMRSSDNQFDSRAWGLFGDVPAPGDYDGDHRADLAVRRDTGSPQAVFYLQESTAGFRTVTFGFPDDNVVPGDYDGDGKTDLAVTRKSGGQLNWFALRSSDSTVQGLSWGIDTDLTVQGDYDGDGLTDAAIWRASPDPAANRFWALGTGGSTLIQQWGLQGDYPVANFNTHGASAPAITSPNAATFIPDVANTFTVTTTGFPRPTIARTGALPSGVTFVDNGDGTGTLAGTPPASASGTYPLTFQATSSGGSSPVQNFTLTVGGAPSITSAASTTFLVGSSSFFTVTTSGLPVPTIARGGVALPPGVTFTDNLDGTGTLEGVPTSGGVFALTFTATNSAGSSPAQNFTLTVNGLPAITSAAAATFTEGVAGSFTVTTSGFPTPSITRGGVALPAGVTFVDNGDGTGTLSGTPAAATGGIYNITFTAANTQGSSPAQVFTLTVNSVPAIASPAATTFTVGVADSFTVVANGFPTPSITIGGVALPSGVTFTPNGDGTGTLAGTPAAATGGAYAITFTATNAAGSSAPQAFTLTITQAPVITSPAAVTFTVGTPGTFTVTTTGYPPPTIEAGGLSLPTGVTFTDNLDGTGTLAGTPAAGTGSDYAIVFTATNLAGNATPQNFALTVRQAPAITTANAETFMVGTPGTFTVNATGYPNGAEMAIGQSGTLPAGVTFTNNLDGTATLAGTPAAATGGIYPLTFTASNGVSPNATQNFTLTVGQAAAISSAASTTFTTTAQGLFTITATGFPAPMITIGGVALPTGVSFAEDLDDGPALIGTPGPGTGGTYAITFTATNSYGSSAPQAFTLTVNQPPAITSAAEIAFVTTGPYTFTIPTTTGFPAPTIARGGVALPTGVTFSDNLNGTGTLSGQPGPGTGGTYAITFTATNSSGSTPPQAFTLTVNDPPAITSAASTAFTTAGPGTFTVTTTGYPAPTIALGGVALPSGVAFTDNGNGTGTLAGTPGAATGGTYAITFTAENSTGSTSPQAFTLTVNQPAVITSGAAAFFMVNEPGSFTVIATGFPAPTIALGGTIPASLTFVDNGNGTGTLSGTPNLGEVGLYPLTFTASNSSGSSTPQDFTLIVGDASGTTIATAMTRSSVSHTADAAAQTTRAADIVDVFRLERPYVGSRNGFRR